MKESMKNLRSVLNLILLILVFATGTANAQGTISTTTCPGAGCVDADTSNQGSIGIQVTGTWSGTITFQGSVNGTTFTSLVLVASNDIAFTPVTTTTGNGVWNGSIAGLQKVRVVFTSYVSGSALVSIRSAQSAKKTGGGAGGGGGSTIIGGTCTNQAMSAISAPGVPSCSTVTSAFVDNSVAITGIDINTANQITATHLIAPLPVAQGGTGAATLTGILKGNGVSAINAIAIPADATKYLDGTGAFSIPGTTVIGGTCTNQHVSSISNTGVPTCTSVTSAYVNNTIALTGVDIDTSSQVASTHLSSPLSILQGGTALTASGTNKNVLKSNGTIWTSATPIDGGTCTNQAVTSISTIGVPSCTTVTSAYTNNSIAATGVDINTSNQVTVTHLASALPAAQGGTAVTSLSAGLTSWFSSATLANWATVTGSQSANCIVAGPDGSSGNLACRTMTSGDLPAAITETVLTSGTAIVPYNSAYASNCGSPCTHTLPTTASHAGQTMAIRGVGGSSAYTLDPNGSQNICDASGCATTKTYSANQSVNLIIDTTGAYWQVVSSERGAGGSSTVFPKNPGGRLTTESGVCKSTSDRTSQGTIYWTPASACGGSSYLALYSGASWVEFTQVELSLALTITSGKNYDVFVSYNSGTPALVLSAAWTNDTTRADAVALQDGFVVKSSDHTLLAVAIIRASGSNITEDSAGNSTTQVGGKRFVWNRYNQLATDIGVVDKTDTWNYLTATWRQADGATGNKIEYVTGEANTLAQCSLDASVQTANTGATALQTAIGVDSTSAPTGHYGQYYNNSSDVVIINMASNYRGRPGLGYHFVSWLEIGSTTGTSTFYGDDAGSVASGLLCTVPM